MKRTKIMGLCLMAAFAFCAMAATVASAAEPEWGHCVAMKKGNYTEGNCQKEGEHKGKPAEHRGSYEWIPGSQGCYAKKKGEYTNSGCTEKSAKAHKGSYEKAGGGKFTGNGGSGDLSTLIEFCTYHSPDGPSYAADSAEPVCESEINLTAEEAVECSSETASGEATGTKEVTDVQVTFHNCCALGSVECHTWGSAPGEIKVNELDGELGYIEKATHKVGVVLHPATGPRFVTFVCPNEGEGEEFEYGFQMTVGEGNPTQGYAWQWDENPGEAGHKGNPAPPSGESGHKGIISPVTPINQMTEKFTQVYSISRVGDEWGNSPRHFEGGPTEELETQYEDVGSGVQPEEYLSQWSPAGQEITNVNTTTEGPAEIKG